MSSYKNLFLRQSYLDSYDSYALSLTESRQRPVLWDYIILTASNEAQAEAYRLQIEHRLAGGKLPRETHYAVLPDPEGKRVGSGGATLSVMRYIREREESFKGKRILVIHSGGDSKRVPQYSACGKIFSPVPRMLPDGRRSTLFDEFIIGMTSVPARMADGMLVCSGDVLLLFNPLQIDFYGGGAAALSIKENVSTGKNHGVFLGNENGYVDAFLHKQSEETLRAKGAVDNHGNVNIDTGAIVFGSDILNDLYSLVDTPERFSRYVNDTVRLSFYADFVYPLAESATEEAYYLETPEGEFSDELTACRKELWRVLHGYKMKLLRFSPASFIHFGTTRELLRLVTEEMPSYAFLDWSALVSTNRAVGNFAASHSYVSRKARVGEGSYIEDSYIHKGTVIGKGCVISGVTLDGESVPDGTVLHGLKLRDGRFVVRKYAVSDNPKEALWFGKPLPSPLWKAPLFAVCDTMAEAVDKTLKGETANEMISLEESFAKADVTAILPWQEKLGDRIKAEALLASIDNCVPADEAVRVFRGPVPPRAAEFLTDKAASLSSAVLADFSKKIRIYYYLSRACTGAEREKYLSLCFDTIRRAVTDASGEAPYRTDLSIAKDEVKINLPVRINFGGGWSDTPPYCLENGGTVLNAAVTLNGKMPIEVVMKRIDKRAVALASTDSGTYREFTSTKELQDCFNPADPFALHKAALIACGIIPEHEEVSLDEILDRLGGGIYLSTCVYNIPRGSGLGTSSILAGACVKAIYEFMGLSADEDTLYDRVMCLEQIMSTGGGWQDQVGGIAKGIKMVSSTAGMVQKLTCAPLSLSDETKAALDRRFALVYTGQRRLARNLLREVVGKYIGAVKSTTEALYEIQRVAVLMRFELEKGNIAGFAELLNEHWELSRQIDIGCTNTCIDQIFGSIEDLIDGKMICGAGGGGYLQVLMKEGVSVEDISARLESVFSGSGVEAVKCEFVF